MFIRGFFYILFSTCFAANATESDNYTARDVILSKANAAPAIERLVNDLLAAAVKEANQSNLSETFIEKRVIESTRKRLASDNFGVLATIVQNQSPFQVYGIPVTPLEWVIDQQNNETERERRSSGFLDLFMRPRMNAIQQLNWGEDFKSLMSLQFPLSKYGYRVPIEKSIFKYLNIFESGMSSMPGIMFVASLNLNGSVVGVDKLGHFFAQGYSYFESQNSGRALKRILKDGKTEEEGPFGKGIFGISTFGSGVVSYADLAANFHGLQFWNRLLGSDNPIVKIENNKAIKIRDFRFKDYPVFSWDEAINLSSHHGFGADDIRRGITQAGYKWDRPIDANKAIALSKLNCAAYYTSTNLNLQSECKDLEKISSTHP